MKIPMILVAIVLTTVGCTSENTAPPENSASSEQPTSTPTPEPRSLRETCPDIEAALPGGYMPEAPKMADFLGELASLEEQGDTETKNAIELLRPATAEFHDAIATDAPPADKLDAHSAWLDAISAVADRCAAVGSSALQ